jgi:hypothetical protein
MLKKLFLVAGLFLGSMAYAAANVPFKSSINAETRFIGPCGPGCVNATLSGVGHALQGGLVTLDGPLRVNFGPNFAHQIGTPTITAADGSTLTLSMEGNITPTGPDEFTFSGVWTAIRGTKRFQGVSGSGTYDGFGSGNLGSIYFEGRLNDPGLR